MGKAKKTQPEQPVREATVAPLGKLLLRGDKGAAEFLNSRSEGWVRQQRLMDAARIAQGKPPEFAPWLVIGNSIYWRPEDLRAWVARTAIVRGQLRWRGDSEKAAEGAA
jgi:hypothetical protein